MVVEWTGARVHTSEFEPKSPQVSPKPHGADPQALNMQDLDHHQYLSRYFKS